MSTPIGDAAYQQAIEKLIEVDRVLRDLWKWFVDLVAQALAALPAIGAQLKAAWDRFVVAAQQALDWISRLINEIGGNPTAIRAVGEAWVKQVGGVASTQSQALQRGQLPSNGEWEGSAATAYYTGVVPNQTSPLTAVVDAAKSINQSMNEVANAVSSFWSAIFVAVGSFLGALAGARAIALAGPPGVVLSILATIAACIGFAVAVNQIFTDLGNTLGSKAGTLVEVANSTYLSGGWPSLGNTNTLSDGSVTDGDASEWQPTT